MLISIVACHPNTKRISANAVFVFILILRNTAFKAIFCWGAQGLKKRKLSPQK